MKVWLFWLLWGFDALVALWCVYFLVTGLVNGSTHPGKIMAWSRMLIILAGVLGGSYVLRTNGHGVLAICALGLIALPAVAALLFFLVILNSSNRWN